MKFAIQSMILLGCLGGVGFSSAGGVPKNCNQLVVALAESWDSSSGRLQAYSRKDANSPWVRAFATDFPVLFGRSGLAWGRGVHGDGEGSRLKVERDKRTPAGLFEIGKIYTHDQSLPSGAKYPFRTITKWDAWPDDPNHPRYNRHTVIDPTQGVPDWFESQKMRQGDSVYRWLIEIRHNSDRIVPGAGSAIFFHMRRGPNSASAGCTTLASEDIVALIRWLRETANPHYLVLPKEEYQKRRKDWGLP